MDPEMMTLQPTDVVQSAITRDPPEYSPDECALIDRWISKVKYSEKELDKVFTRMREDMDFAFGKQWETDDLNLNGDKYTANIIQQHIRQRVAALYAKNPKVVCKRNEKLDFEIWDEKPETIQLMMQLAQTPTPQGQANPQAALMLQNLKTDIDTGMQQRQQVTRVAKTLEILFNYVLKEQTPNFKKSMKQLIKRVETVGVAYVKIDFQRDMGMRPEIESQISDIRERLAKIETLAADQQDGITDSTDPEAAELKIALEQLQKTPQIVLREGLIYSFPRSTAIIPDLSCISLSGFVGAEWLAEKFLLTPESIKDIYKIDIGTAFTAYDEKGNEFKQAGLFSKTDWRFTCNQYAVVWEIYDKKTGTRFVLCDGYKGYLQRPEPPPVIVETFFPYVTLMFNEMEHEKQLYPPSDVRLLRHIQKEYNRSKEALRQHRIASSPLYATGAGQFDEEDQLNLAMHQPHDVIVLKGLGEGENVNNKLQQVEKKSIDPNVYETENVFSDMLRVVGTQEAQLGGVSNATATESSIAEDSRLSSISSNADDLDEFLSEMARLGGQVLLREMSAEQVKKYVGRGAFWPELSMEQIMEEIYLSVEAGSSGRPNKAAKASALERSQNLLLSIPGVKPSWLFKQVMETVDETLDLTDAFADGEPSILSLNRLAASAQAAPTNSVNDPEGQADEGFDNLEESPQNRPGPQPVMPGPNSVAPGQMV